jgi:pilus assembly protein FimV
VTDKLRSTRAMAWAAALGLALVLFAGQALALGLGRIEVKSRAGQPLLAEIQVISSDPAELDALRARLASPDTFRRIGLQAPEGIVSDLQFSVALDARGQPVIRVTSQAPVTQPALTFLVEVDWGQGRLVREYSALIDAPQTVSAPAQPAIEAPVAAPSNTIVRAPEPAGMPDPDAVGEQDGGLAERAVEVVEAEDDDGAAATADTPIPDRAATPAPPPAPAPATAAPVAHVGEYGPVQAGETLGAIAGRMAGDGVTREQAIVALFRANPGAFIANNLNLVREGAVLRIPDRSEMAGIDVRESRAVMREQVAAWRDMARPAPQPGTALADGPAGGTAGGGEPATAPRTADARLEIVPPAASDGRQAGIRSGIQAGGEGEMLRQELQHELQQNQESLAARNAEVAELKARVADLERLQAQQAQLITMKDSELAAAQERLATTSAETTDATPPAEAQAGGVPWALIGLGLLLVAAVAWLLIRRAPAATPRPRFDSETLAAAAPRGREAVDADVDRTVESEPPASPATPPWHAGEEAAAVVPDARSPSSGATSSARDAEDAVIASLNPAPGGIERIELARAYIDLGDVDTARDLLREVATAGDPDARAEASRLLEGIA